MKQRHLMVLLCIYCLAPLAGTARASYFDGMEAQQQGDYQTALREFKADEDDSRALYMVGVMYEKGDGVSQDYAEAAKWYQKAIDKGDAAALYRLGRLYERGEGVDQNMDEAIKLYKQAAKRGYVDAKEALKRITTE